jgi:hypothetical protein
MRSPGDGLTWSWVVDRGDLERFKSDLDAGLGPNGVEVENGSSRTGAGRG